MTRGDVELIHKTVQEWNKQNFRGWFDIRMAAFFADPLSVPAITFGKRTKHGSYLAFTDRSYNLQDFIDRLPDYLKVLKPWMGRVKKLTVDTSIKKNLRKGSRKGNL